MCLPNLPISYVSIGKFESQSDKKLRVKIAATSVFIILIMVCAAIFFIPFSDFVSFSAPRSNDFIKLLLLVPATAITVISHELIRAWIIRRLTKEKVKIGFSGLLIYTSSHYYFDRKSMVCITMLPILICFIVFLILNAILPETYFWFFYILQIINLSGESESYHLVYHMRSMPESVLALRKDAEIELYLKAELVNKNEQ